MRRLARLCWPDLIVILLGCVGAALYRRGTALPMFVDESTAMTAFARACTDTVPIKDWWRAVDALRTAREPLLYGGVGLILLAVTVELLRVAMLMPRVDTMLRTPLHGWAFVPIGTGAVLLGVTGYFLALESDQQAYHFPPCADSIAIPMGGILLLTAVILPCLMLAGWLIQRRFGSLPVSLGLWDDARSRRSWIGLIVFGVPAALLACLSILALRSSEALLIPAYLVSAYLLASTRAALLARP